MKKISNCNDVGYRSNVCLRPGELQDAVACSPQDVKTYDTNRLRSSFLMEKVMVPNEINVTYSMYDRLIFGGAVPATKRIGT